MISKRKEMEKCYKLILFVLLSVFVYQNKAIAAPGDTTTVTIFKDMQPNHNGLYDTIVALPASAKQFQKIRLIYTLGRRACSGAQYCGSWDYTTGVYAKEAHSNEDSVEMMRVITPYATNWSLSRKFNYVEEVTDYSSILHDSTAFTYYYSGYSWGFTVTLKLQMIEGTPPRKAIAVKNIYDGYLHYGDDTDPIENHLTQKTENYQAPAVTARIKNIISGHGSDANGCGEFCKKWYQQKVDGNVIAQKDLWKADCGLNQLYPQSGTWIYNRANWCPGEEVLPIYHDLSDYTTAGTNFTVNMDMQPYSVSNPSAGLNLVSQLITYAAPSYQLDAAITAIISPNDNENYVRDNPICAHPKIKIRNEGSTPLTSVKIAFGVEGGAKSYYTWTGNLGFMKEEVVDLGKGIQALNAANSSVFIATIVEINGQSSDATDWNNTYRSTFTKAPQYPGNLVIRFKTNGSKDVQNANHSETSWKIVDEDGNTVASRENNAVNTEYNDTIQLSQGCYTFIMDDAGCDGFQWWNYQNYNPNPGIGKLIFFNNDNGHYIEDFPGDFGCQFKQPFTVGYEMSTKEMKESGANFNLYPNPVKNTMNLQFSTDVQQINYAIIDAKGTIVQKARSIELKGGKAEISTTKLANGSYTMKCSTNKNNERVLVRKFLIRK